MKKLLAVFSVAFIFLYANAQEVADLKEPSSEVKELMKKHKLKEVDFDYVKQIADVSKDKEIIVFCGGYACTKSAIVADLLMKKGHKNVKVYNAGEPEWSKKDYLEVDTLVVKAYFENNSALLVDARPHVKYLQETILGSISIPDTNIDKWILFAPVSAF